MAEMLPEDHAPLRLGLIGCLPHSIGIIDAARSSPNIEVYAAASRDRGELEQWLEPADIDRLVFCDSYNEVLKTKEVDAVFISLPTSKRHKWCVAAAQMHKHVLVEKPLAAEWSEAVEIRDICAREDVALMDASTFCHHARTKQMLEQCAAERSFGEVRRVECAVTLNGTQDFLRGCGGKDAAAADPLGCLGELGWSACRAGLMLYCDRPHSCRAYFADSNDEGLPLDVSGVCFFGPDGTKPLHFHCSYVHPFQQKLTVLGDNKIVTCDDFLYPKNKADATFSVEAFPPCAVSPLIDLDSVVVSTSNETHVFNAPCQRKEMLDLFADLALSAPGDDLQAHKHGYEDRDTFRRIVADEAVHTQALVTTLVESLRSDGALLECPQLSEAPSAFDEERASKRSRFD